MKRLLILADGSSIHSVKWVEGLLSTGEWKIALLSMNPDRIHPELQKFSDRVQIIQIPPKNISEHGNNYQYLFNLPKIFMAVREFRPDVISTVYLSSYGFVGALVKGSANLAHFIVGNDVMIFPEHGWFKRELTKWALGRADFVVSASQTMTNKIIGYGVPEDQILTQQYGVSDKFFNYPVASKVVDFVSNRAWVENSNIPYLLDVLTHFESCTLSLIGAPVTGSEALSEQILSRVQDRVQIRQMGALPYQENIDQVALARFVVSLTTSDGASLSVLEGMALGCIPILSDTAPNREWVKHGENGILVPLGDVEEARKRVAEVLTWTQERRLTVVAANRTLVRDRASLSKNMGKVSEAFARLNHRVPNKGKIL